MGSIKKSLSVQYAHLNTEASAQRQPNN
jgi:hypothetical protein